MKNAGLLILGGVALAGGVGYLLTQKPVPASDTSQGPAVISERTGAVLFSQPSGSYTPVDKNVTDLTTQIGYWLHGGNPLDQREGLDTESNPLVRAYLIGRITQFAGYLKAMTGRTYDWKNEVFV